MRNLSYTLLPPVGSTETPAVGTVADLLRDVPYLFSAGLIPPLVIINGLLREGIYDAGMSGGCRWAPFTLAPNEFDEVVADLVSHGDREGEQLRYMPAPEWVTDRRRWTVWETNQAYSIPIEEHLRLQAEMEAAEIAMKHAEENGDEEAQYEHLSHLQDLSSQWCAFISKYRIPPFGSG